MNPGLEFQRAFSLGLEHALNSRLFRSVGEFAHWQPLAARFCCSFSGLLLPVQATSRISSGCGAIGLLNFRHFRSQTASKLTLRNIATSPPPDHTGSGMAFLAPGGDNRKLSRDDRVIDRHHLGEGEGRAEDLDPSVERLSPPLPGFLDAAAVL